MKLLSDASEYGLRAVVWLAQCPAEPQKVKEIADQIKAAPGYLIKVLQDLTKAGILSARRGSQGGFQLQRDPASLTALDVINAIDPFERISSCPLSVDEHAIDLCPIHLRIDMAMAQIEEAFRELTIGDVVSRVGSSPALCEVLIPSHCQADAAKEDGSLGS